MIDDLRLMICRRFAPRALLAIGCWLLAIAPSAHADPANSGVKIFQLPDTNFVHAFSVGIVNVSTNSGDTMQISLTNLLESMKTYANWDGGGAGSVETQY